MYISRVSIKGIHNVSSKTYDLDKMTYLYGSNGAGKSTVLQSIQLCLLGYIPGTNKTSSAIMSHSNGNEMSVTVTVVDDNNSFDINRSFIRTGTKIVDKVSISDNSYNLDDIIGDISLPIFDWNEFTNLTANKMKDWFIKFLPSGDDIVSWERELNDLTGVFPPSDMVDEYIDLINDIDHDSSVDWVSKVNTLLKDRLSYSKAVLDEKEKSINALIRYEDDDIPSDGSDLSTFVESLRVRKRNNDNVIMQQNKKIQEYTEAQKQNSYMTAMIDACNSGILSEDELTDVKSKIESKRSDIESSNDVLESLQTKLASEKQEYEESKFDDSIVEKKSAMSKLLDVLKSNGTCPYTKESCKTITTRKAEAHDTYISLKAELDDLLSKKQTLEDSIKTDENEIRTIQSTLAQMKNSLELLNKQITNSESNKSKIEEFKSKQVESISSEEYRNIVESIDSLKCDNEDLTRKITKIEANIQYNRVIDSLTSEKSELEDTITILKAWIKHTGENGLQTTLAMNPFKNMERSMDSYLQTMFGSGVSCKFNVTNKANSFSFGIVRDRSYIPYDLLSTGEKTLYTFALMLYLVDSSSSPLHIMLMDDFLDHLDYNRLDSLFKVLSSGTIETQIIMAGVRNCDIDGIKTITIG